MGREHEDDDALDVSDAAGYSRHTSGPRVDTRVHTKETPVPQTRARPPEPTRRTTSRPPPLPNLRAAVRSSDEVALDRPDGPPSPVALALAAGGVGLVFLAIVTIALAVVFSSHAADEESPTEIRGVEIREQLGDR